MDFRISKTLPETLPETLVELVSDGDLDDLFSDQLCNELSQCFSGNKAVVIRGGDNCPPLVHATGVDAKSVRAYEEYFYRLDPMSHCRSFNTPVRMSDTVPEKCFESSEFYNDFFKPIDSFHSLSLSRRVGEGNEIEIAIARGKKSADFDAEDKRLVKAVGAMLAARVGVLQLKEKVTQSYRLKKLEQVATLSERELEIFLHIADGKSVNQFVQKNKISVHTARTLLKSLRLKLNANSQLELARIASVIV